MKAEAAPSPCAELRGTSGWGTSVGALTAHPRGLTQEILASPRRLAAPAPQRDPAWRLSAPRRPRSHERAQGDQLW